MEPIRIAWGVGRGPTRLSAYDAALAEAGVHDYNLRQLSSVIPAGATVEEVGTVPDLGPGGQGLHVVEASAVGRNGPQTAVLAWARSPDGPGLFYEAGASEPSSAVVEEVLTGIDAGIDLRDRPYGEPRTRVVTVDAAEGHVSERAAGVADGGSSGVPDEPYAAAVAIAAYGRSEPLL